MGHMARGASMRESPRHGRDAPRRRQQALLLVRARTNDGTSDPRPDPSYRASALIGRSATDLAASAIATSATAQTAHGGARPERGRDQTRAHSLVHHELVNWMSPM